MWGALHHEILSLVAMADVACPDLVAGADRPGPEEVNAQTISETITEVLQGQYLAKISLGEPLRQMSVKLGFLPDALDARREEIKGGRCVSQACSAASAMTFSRKFTLSTEVVSREKRWVANMGRASCRRRREVPVTPLGRFSALMGFRVVQKKSPLS